MAGLDMGCFFFNRAWLDYRGRSTEQEQGNGWAEGVHPEDMERCVNFYISCFEQRAPFAMTYRLKNAAGEYHTILDRGAPHYDGSDKFLGYFGGCAVLENRDPSALNREIRSSLEGVATFALELARREAEGKRAGDHVAAQTMRHAVAQMKRLSTDMLTYRNIGAAVCLK